MMVNSIYTKEYSVGIEAEGHIIRENIRNGCHHHDGSVEVKGSSERECDYSCRDNCECFNDCVCDSCVLCSDCGDSTSNCCCDSCSKCDVCDEDINYCECPKAHSSSRRDGCSACWLLKFSTDHTVEESEMIACENCIAYYIEEYRTANCADSGNETFDCDRDCSCECMCECDCGSGALGDDGEIVSNILKESEIDEWFNDNKMAIEETNKTCGLHVHVGNLNIIEYGILMSESFHIYLKTELLEWGKEMNIREGSQFFKRLEGANTFTRDAFRAEEQKMDLDKTSARYCFINYCWALHRTVEIRVLPCFQRHDLRSKAVKKVVEIIHSYINKSKPKIHILEIKEVV